jgi:hypothetical protein
LWDFRIHGNSMEVITPSSTASDTFVSVFITQRGNEYIVSDGGWISDECYGMSLPFDTSCFERLFSYYYNFYGIKETQGKGKTIYYKKTTDEKFIPNLVYDLSGFISIIVSSSFINFSEEKEGANITRFKTEANKYLASVVNKKHIKFDAYIDVKFRSVKFGAVITKKNRFNLINYITGSTVSYFLGSMGKANLNFELIDLSSYSEFIDKKIVIIDNSASGCKTGNISVHLDYMKSKDGLTGINWSEKERIEQLLS